MCTTKIISPFPQYKKLLLYSIVYFYSSGHILPRVFYVWGRRVLADSVVEFCSVLKTARNSIGNRVVEYKYDPSANTNHYIYGCKSFFFLNWWCWACRQIDVIYSVHAEQTLKQPTLGTMCMSFLCACVLWPYVYDIRTVLPVTLFSLFIWESSPLPPPPPIDHGKLLACHTFCRQRVSAFML